jgi:hypothetical protein
MAAMATAKGKIDGRLIAPGYPASSCQDRNMGGDGGSRKPRRGAALIWRRIRVNNGGVRGDRMNGNDR